MKLAISFLCLVLVLTAGGNEPPYQAKLMKILYGVYSRSSAGSKKLEEAEQFATTIRGFIIRGDVEGMGEWVKSVP